MRDAMSGVTSHFAISKALALGGWALASWVVISAGIETAAITFLFYGGVLLPLSLIVRRGLEKIGIREPTIALHAFVLAWLIGSLLFFVRKLFAGHEFAFDLGVLLVLPTLCFVGHQRARTAESSREFGTLRKRFNFYDFAFGLVLLPLLIGLVRTGNEVIEEGNVAYYGQLYIDFGVLKGITNLLVASDFLPESFVYGTGSLSYHWLFFAVPAWNSDLLGQRHDMNGVLSIANYLAAIFFYCCLSQAIALATGPIGGVNRSDWSRLGAIAVIFGSSIRYFHEAAFSITGWSFLGLGERNRLLLSLPNSMINFGNSTFALGLLLLALASLSRWNKSGNKWDLWFSCLWVAFLPMFSATTVPGVAIGIVIACLWNQVRSPWFSLICFAVVGLVIMLFFRLLGAFDSQADPPQISWDGGQFFKNCLFASPLIALPLLLVFRSRHQENLWNLCVCAGIGLIGFPSFVMLGQALTSSDLSMKNYTAIVAVLGGLAVITLFKPGRPWGASNCRGLRIVGGVMILLGLINSSAYAMSSLMMRYPASFGPVKGIRGVSRTTLDRDFFRALSLINERYDPSAVVLSEPSTLLIDPVVVVAGRRPFLANEFSLGQSIAAIRQELFHRDANWRRWKESTFSDKPLSHWFSERVDILLVDQEFESSHWSSAANFGKWHVYEASQPRANADLLSHQIAPYR